MTTHTTPALNRDGTPAPHGRRTRLTDDVIDKTAADVRNGAPPLHALVEHSQVARTTASHWLKIGRREDPKNPPHDRHLRLVEEVERAESEWLANTVKAWSGTDGKHWKLELAAVAARFPEYRQQAPARDEGTPLAALTEHLREMRKLVEAGRWEPELEVIDVESKELPEGG